MLTNVDLFVPMNCSLTNNLAEAAAKIAYHTFYWEYPALVFLNTTFLCGIETFMKVYQKNVEIGRNIFYTPQPSRFRQHILFTTNVATLSHMLRWMDTQQFFNSGKYIIICQSEDPKECDEGNVMQDLWSHKIVNVVFLNSGADYQVKAYTYHFEERICRNGNPVALDIKTCFRSGAVADCRILFQEKLSNLHRCPLIVSTFLQKPFMFINHENVPFGSDGNLLVVLSERLNATLEVMMPRKGFGWGSLTDQGEWVGSLGDVYYDWANMSMTTPAITLTRYTHFQISSGYTFMSLSWFTTSAVMKPAYLKLLDPFQAQTHMAVVLTFVLVFFSAVILKTNKVKQMLTQIKYEPIGSSTGVIFYSWAICMGLPSKKLPTQRNYVVIVFYWIWLCFLIRTFYQACLIGALKNNRYYVEMKSIEDVMAVNYKFGGVLALRDYYVNYPEVYKNWFPVNVTDILPTLVNISKGAKFAITTGTAVGQRMLYDNNITVNVLPQKVVKSPAIIFFKKFSPLADPVNVILNRLVEAGFVSKFHKDFHKTNKIKHQTAQIPINTGHFAGCYAILITGWLLSFVILCIEIVHKKINFQIDNELGRCI